MLSISCLVISGIVGLHTLASYNSAKTLGDIYDVIPHGWDFLQGLNIVANAGIATFSWQLFLLCFATCNFAIIDGLFDLALAMALIVGVVKQHRFLPGSYAYCNDAADWKNGTDGRNFFLVASPFYNNDEPKDICHAMVYNWIMAIVVITLSLISFLLNVSIGCFCLKESRDNYCRQFRILSAPFVYIQNHTEAAGRFSFRYVYKLFAHMTKSHRDLGLKKASEREVNQEDSQLYLHLPYELVVMISRDLHYADLVNVSWSSKRLRRAFFGSGDVAATIRGLGRYVCEGTGRKSKCTFCKSKICFGCRMNIQYQQSNSFGHLKNCRPNCSKCMYKNHFVVDDDDATSNRNRRDQRDLEMSGGSDTSLRLACRICAGKSLDDRLAVIDARDKVEIQRLAKQLLTCEECNKMLPTTGPRWWIDSDTGKECRSSVHPDWATGKDDVQV